MSRRHSALPAVPSPLAERSRRDVNVAAGTPTRRQSQVQSVSRSSRSQVASPAGISLRSAASSRPSSGLSLHAPVIAGGSASKSSTPRATRAADRMLPGSPTPTNDNRRVPLAGSNSKCKRKAEEADNASGHGSSVKRSRSAQQFQDENRTPNARSLNSEREHHSVKKSSSPAALTSSTKRPARTASALERARGDAERAEQVDKFLDLLPRYRIAHAMHLHWRSDANDDEDMTDPEVWRCRFAPTTVSQRRNGIASHMFATCGSNSVCVVDCDTGRPVKKYLHYDEPAEVFQCLDWTVVEAGDEETLVLAVGGKAKTIKLISLKQNVVYRYLTGHRGELNDLRFLRTEPTQLLSAASDGAVYLWDIGAGFDTDVGGSLLRKFSVDRYAYICISLSPDESSFLATNENCAVHQYALNASAKGKRSKLQHQGGKRGNPRMVGDFDGDGWHTSCVDAVHWLSEKDVLTKACANAEMIVWDRSMSTDDAPAVRTACRWQPPASTAENMYGLGSTVVGSRDRKVLVTATIDGALEFFDLNIAALPNAIKPRSPKKPEPVIVARKQSKRGKVVVQDVTEDDDDDDASGPTCGHTPLAPVATLYDPRAKRHHVRSVDISDDFKFVVAVGHGDLTCIWAAAEDKVAQ